MLARRAQVELVGLGQKQFGLEVLVVPTRLILVSSKFCAKSRLFNFDLGTWRGNTPRQKLFPLTKMLHSLRCVDFKLMNNHSFSISNCDVGGDIRLSPEVAPLVEICRFWMLFWSTPDFQIFGFDGTEEPGACAR